MLTVPQSPSLLDPTFQNQALIVDRNANPIGFVWSITHEGRIGS
jgi:hypothetical protein